MVPPSRVQGDSRAMAGQGAGSGRAVIYQDRFDPAAGFMQYAVSVRADKAKRQAAAVKRQKEAFERIKELEYEAADEVDAKELQNMWETSMNDLTTIVKSQEYGDVLDPTSQAGRTFFRVQKALETASTMSAENLKLLNEQISQFRSNPSEYNAEEFEKRMKYYNELPTISERNAFLRGEIMEGSTLPTDYQGAGMGLLVEDLDLLEPVEGIDATEWESLIEEGDATIGKKYADKDKTRDLVTKKLLSQDKFDRQVNAWMRKPLEGYKPTEEGYIEYLTDYLVDQVNTKSTRTEDEDDSFSFRYGNGWMEVDETRFGFGVQKANAVHVTSKATEGETEGATKPANDIAKQLGVDPNTDVAIASISTKGGKAKVFNYQMQFDGVNYAINMSPSKLVKVGDKYYLQGDALKDVEEADKGELLRVITALGAYTGRGDIVGVPLDIAGNQIAFETQFGVDVDVLGEQMDAYMGNQRQAQPPAEPKPKESTPEKEGEKEVDEIEVAAEAAVDQALSAPTTPDSKVVIENMLKTKGAKGKIEGSVVVVGGNTYDLTKESDRKMFKVLYYESNN